MGGITMMKTPAETGLANHFALNRAMLPGDAAQREEAFRRFAERGLPHRRVEEWKYTDLRALMREAAPPAARLDDPGVVARGARSFAGLDAIRVAIVNGHVAEDASSLADLPEGLEVVPLAQAMGQGHPLLGAMGAVEAARENAAYQLNAAFMMDGVLIRVAAGTTLERPVHLAFTSAGDAPFSTATRVLVLVEVGASLTLIESHEGPDGVAYQPNDVVEIIAADHSCVTHVRLNGEGSDALALSTLTAKLGAKVAFDTLNVSVGANVARHQVYLACTGEETRAGIRGATMLKGRQHADTTLVVDHIAEGCVSRELFKTVIDGDATGVFQGKIMVKPEAQKTDGRMMSAALLLSEGGTMNNKPELEIFADDVQCAHGATCGELDEDLLFYLMARGLPKPEAEQLLVQAFLGEAIEEGVEDDAVRETLTGVLEDWLRARA